MKTVPLYEQLANKIQDFIIEEQYQDGDKLPSERKLSDLFGIGRAPVREALRSLVVAGVLEARYSEGIFVKNKSILEIMNWNKEMISILDKEENIGEVLELRTTLELSVAEAATEKASNNDILSLKACLNGMEENVSNPEECLNCYLEFHKILAKITGNKFFVLLLKLMMFTQGNVYKKLLCDPLTTDVKELRSKLYVNHAQIYNAIKSRNQREARNAIAEHMSFIKDKLLEMDFAQKSLGDRLKSEIESISIGVITFEASNITPSRFMGLTRAIENIAQKRVDWFFPTNYSSLIDAQMKGFVHIGYYGPRSYIVAHERSHGTIEAFALARYGRGISRTRARGYYSNLIIKADSPYKSIGDLAGKTLALTDPISTSGDLIPKIQLGQKIGRRLSEYFFKTPYVGRQDEAALAVLKGEVDAAVVADMALEWGVDNDRFSPKDFRVLWKSRLIPFNPFAWRTDLPDELKEKIRKAFLDINETDYGKEFLKALRSECIMLVNDRAYNGIRRTFRQISKWI
jgi:phosphonate transport system substrate-binding protein